MKEDEEELEASYKLEMDLILRKFNHFARLCLPLSEYASLTALLCILNDHHQHDNDLYKTNKNNINDNSNKSNHLNKNDNPTDK